MFKTKTAEPQGEIITKDDVGKLPAEVVNNTIPDYLREGAEKYADAGVSTAAQDNIVPLIYILQALSPQVNPRNNEYIEGAQPGDIWLRNASPPVVAGAAGFLFQPCYFYKDWVVWGPNRGGYKGRWDNVVKGSDDLPAPEARGRQAKDPKSGQLLWQDEEGNDLVLTRYHAGFVLRLGFPKPYLIPFSASGHQVSRGWMNQISGKILPGGKQRAPSFSSLYQLRTRLRSNDQGEWFQFMVDDAGWVSTKEELERGAELYEAFASGAKKADAPQGGGELNDEAPF